MKKAIILLFISISFIQCNSLEHKKNIKTTEEFYNICADRKDVNKLIELYSDSNPQWIDAVARSLVEGKENIKSLYEASWEDNNYKKHQDYPKTIALEEILANDSVVVVSGQYNPYYYNGNLVAETKFTAWLYFNKDGKIKKHIEWMQYSVNDLQDIINFKQSAEIH
ncbi:MAG: hypothetical protein LBQ84_01165 [Flavobacteriaceae bacterium]|jgi:hypothetical protein|nr:hypothetical protein [Flavobacteriaceae bacterium]